MWGVREREPHRPATPLRVPLLLETLQPRSPSPPPQSVSYKWLAREFSLPATLAKQLLFAYLEQAKDGAAATYLVAGWEKEAKPASHVVRLVPGTRLADARAALDPVTSVHVYSVAPCQPKDPADVWNADAAQTATLFAGLLKGEANPLTDNRCSAIAGPHVAWAGRKAPEPPVAPAPPPAKAATAGLLKVDPSKPPASTAPQGKAGGKKKAGGIMSQIAAAAARPKAATKVAPKPEPMEEDDDEPPVRRGGGGAGPATGRARAVVDSSSDEEEEEGAGAADAAPPSPAAALSPSPSPAAAKRSTPPGGVKAGAVAGAKKRKVTRTTINAKGEEVTEVIMEDVSEDGGAGVENEAGEGVAAVPAVAATVTAPSPTAGAAKGAGAKKKPSPAGGKKAPPAGQKSLLGFFGKK